VSHAGRRVADNIRNDKKLKTKIAKIERKLNLSRMKTPLFYVLLRCGTMDKTLYVRHKKVNIMGHYCRICGSTKPNEKFSGKGHRNHVCKECAKMPKEERDAIEQEVEIFGFLSQSNISKKNISRLNTLASSPNEHISNLSDIVIEVAKVKPHKKRRLKVLARERRDLLHKLRETGLIYAHHL